MRRETGYTIIEIILFVAISGLLILGVLAGFRGSLQSNRYTDTTRSFESHIESQYSGVKSGSIIQDINANGKVQCDTPQESYPGSSDVCVIIGKLLRFTTGVNSSVTTHNIVANIEQSDACHTPATVSGVELLKRYCPRVLDMDQVANEASPQWAAQISKVGFLNTSGNSYQPVNYIAFMRDPASELVYVVPFHEPAASLPTPYQLRNEIDPAYANTRGTICLSHDTAPPLTSYVLFNGGEGIGSIESASDNSVLTGGLQC